jgi:hypothetical protein
MNGRIWYLAKCLSIYLADLHIIIHGVRDRGIYIICALNYPSTESLLVQWGDECQEEADTDSPRRSVGGMPRVRCKL